MIPVLRLLHVLPVLPVLPFLPVLFLLQFCFFFFNDTATTEIYTLSLHDALPIFAPPDPRYAALGLETPDTGLWAQRSEEHTSELQSHSDLVCRRLLEKKKKQRKRLNSALTRYQHNARGSSGSLSYVFFLMLLLSPRTCLRRSAHGCIRLVLPSTRRTPFTYPTLWR